MGAAMKMLRWLPPWIVFLWGVSSGLALAQDRLLILSSDNENVEELVSVLRQELSAQFDIRRELVPTRPTSTSYQRYELYLQEHDPQILVLLNNAAVYDYKRYQMSHPERQDFPPTVVSMTALMESEIRGMINTTGVSYEIPAIISFGFVRDCIDEPVQRIGVIFRSRFRSFVDKQDQLARDEAFQLIGYEISDDERNFSRALSRGLRQLTRRQQVDAIWVLNDNKLVNADMVTDVWMRQLRDFHKPVVVGVPSMVKVPGFGNFGVTPDHEALAHQIANMVSEIKANGFHIGETPPERPHSIEKHVRVDFARRYLGFIESKLPEIDEVVD